MLATAAPDRFTEPLEHVALGDLVLRLCPPPRNGQIIRLHAAKCTVGSGNGCTLRLRASGVAPLNCMILRGPGRAIVRCWNPDTRLNHRAFTDAPLVSGDRLGIGPIELEVVSIGDAEELNPIAEEIRALAEQRQLIEKERRVLAESQQAFEERHLRHEAERDEWERHCDCQRETEAARLAEWETQQRTLQYERQALAEQQKLLQDERERLAEQRQTLQDERQALAEQQKKLQDEREGLEEERDSLAEQRSKLEARRHEMEECLSHAREVEPDRPMESDELIEVEEPPRAVEFSQVSPEAPVNLSEVFRAVGARVETAETEWPDAESPKLEKTQDAFTPKAGLARDERSRRAAPSAVKTVGEDEESIDAYMAQLMQRIRATSASVHAESHPAQKAETPDGVEREVPPAPAPAPPELPTPAAKPIERTGHGEAAEKNIDLTALRELANLSAQSAISRYARRSLIRSMRSKLLVTGVALASGALLLWFWKTSCVRDVTLGAALVAWLAALYWGMQYALLTGRLIISKSGGIDWNYAKGSEASENAEPSKETPAADADAPADAIP